MAVYREGNSWYFITRVTLQNGEVKQIKRRGFDTKREARLAEAELELLYESMEYDQEYVSFSFVANEYLEWYKKRRKLSSYTKISSIVRVHLIPHFGNKLLHRIKPRDITRYQDDLIDAEYAASHIKKIHTTLSAIFGYAIKQEYTKENPASVAGNVELEDNKHMNYWTLEEFKEFISHVDDPMYYALFMTLYYSGMRKGELLALTWSDVDFEQSTINVDKTEYNRQITTTKTKASQRVILMPRHIMVLISKIKPRKAKTNHVVFGELNTSISTSTLDVRYAEYIKKSGVKRIRLHDFRHSHASYLINKGAVISMVAARLGHSDVATTLNTYGHLYPSTEKEAVLAMEDDFKVAQIVQIRAKK